MLADAYLAVGRPMHAVTELRKLSAIAPGQPSVWYALGQVARTFRPAISPLQSP